MQNFNPANSVVIITSITKKWLRGGTTPYIRISGWLPVKQNKDNVSFLLAEDNRLTAQHISTYIDFRNNKRFGNRIECSLWRKFKITKKELELYPEFCLCLAMWSLEEKHVNLN